MIADHFTLQDIRVGKGNLRSPAAPKTLASTSGSSALTAIFVKRSPCQAAEAFPLGGRGGGRKRLSMPMFKFR
jgi:hypothetical protein